MSKKFVKVASVSDLRPGERLWYDFPYETVVVFNVDGNYYAIADICTHDGGPLADGELEGCEIICPRHGARFDIRTGEALTMPAVVDVDSYEVRVEGDDILVEAPEEEDW